MLRGCTAAVASVLFICGALVGGSYASCSGMCCSGRNNTCVAKGPRISGQHVSSGNCYCDDGCTAMGDCCMDYKAHCKPTDCMVSDWFSYGDCSKECGLGQKVRRRDVLIEPKNGGKRCPELQQTTTCIGFKCKTTRHAGSGRAARETANIMPAEYGKYRTMTEYDFSKDIRKNLFYKYYKKYDISRNGYCSKFKVTNTRRSCASGGASWTDMMELGAVVCVECQKTAMERNLGERCKGHGQLDVDTNWKAVNVPSCHGWWQLVEEQGACTCTGNGTLDLIFV